MSFNHFPIPIHLISLLPQKKKTKVVDRVTSIAKKNIAYNLHQILSHFDSSKNKTCDYLIRNLSTLVYYNFLELFHIFVVSFPSASNPNSFWLVA
jgi:hypothetical protein